MKKKHILNSSSRFENDEEDTFLEACRHELTIQGVQFSQPITGAADGILPTLLVALIGGIAGGMLSSIGEDIWTALKTFFHRSVRKLDFRSGGTQRILGVYIVGQIEGLPVIYYARPEYNGLHLDFSHEDLRKAELAIQLLKKTNTLPEGKIPGIRLDRLNTGPFIRFFEHIPSIDLITEEILSPPEKELSAWDHALLGTAFARIGDYSEARKHYYYALNEFAGKDFPGLASLHWSLGLTYSDQGDLDTALQHWREAALLDGKIYNIHYNTACFYARRGDVQSAIKELRLAISNGFNNASLIVDDHDFDSIRDSNEIQEILQHLYSTHDNHDY